MRPEDLRDFLGRQRWFAGKGRQWTVTRVQPLAWLREDLPSVRIELVTIRYAEGDEETYQVPLVRRSEAAQQLEHVLVGWEYDERFERDVAVYDALHDKEVTGTWLRNIADNIDLGSVVFHKEPVADTPPITEHSIVIGAEQSNTSLVFGDAAILKVFRKVSPGTNPDIEVHAALTEVGSGFVAPLLGWADGWWTDSLESDVVQGSLAMLQKFLPSATDGWQLARTSVRDLFAEADLHADEVGGDFAAESERLGVATAEVHRALANTLQTGTAGPEELTAAAAGMQRRLEHAVAAVPELAPYAKDLAATYDALAAADLKVAVQRVHGDYHLGQVMRTDTGWVLLDFEGEPARPLAERRALSSPLRDVAGMLRSYDYAARQQLIEGRHHAQLEYRAEEWVERNTAAFCDGYARASGRDPRGDTLLLRAFEMDKAVYEVVYESRHRPGWLPIPLSAVDRLVGPSS